MKMQFVFAAFLGLMAASASTATERPATQKVDQKRLTAAMDVLLVTSKANGATTSFGATKVKGATVREMLQDFASMSGYENVELHMTKDQVPDSEDGSSIVGLARNVDVVYLAVDSSQDNNLTDAQRKALTSKALKALFEVTASGALVGAESRSWTACGTSIPGIIILDPSKKTIYQLGAESGC